MQTNAQQTQPKDEHSLLEDLEKLAGEIRVRIHLAGMDLKDEWNKIEPHVLDAREKIANATGAPKRTLEDLVARAKKLRDAL